MKNALMIGISVKSQKIRLFTAAILMKNKKRFAKKEAKRKSIKPRIRWDKFNISKFRRRINVELEHEKRDLKTNVSDDSLLAAGKIALAHPKEFPEDYSYDDYYRLEMIEKEEYKFLGKIR